MGTKKRVNKYPRAFKLMAVERMKKCENVSELAKELGIDRSVLYHWRNHLKMIEGGAADSPVRELRRGHGSNQQQTDSEPQTETMAAAKC